MTKRRSYKKDFEQSEAQRQQLEQEVKLLREQLDAQKAEPPSTQERWLKRNIFIMEGIGILIAAIVGIQTCRQTTFLENQTEIMAHQDTLIQNQNARIDVQIALAEAERRGNLVFLMSNIMDKVDEELKEDWNNDGIRNISPQLIGRIAALSQAMLPYRYLKDSVLIERPLSPERGQLLTALVKTKFDSTAYRDIYQSVKFQDADLQNAKLNRANLDEVNLFGANLHWAELNGAKLCKANLIMANFHGASLISADLDEANLMRTNLIYADLMGADLVRADIRWANLSRVKLNKANLREADLGMAKLRLAYLSKANLRWTNLNGANLNGADLSGADLSGADLHWADFSEVDLRKVNLAWTDLNYVKNITFEQLSESKSLYECQGIPDSLLTRLQKEKPELFEKPKWWDDMIEF